MYGDIEMSLDFQLAYDSLCADLLLEWDLKIMTQLMLPKLS